MIRRGWWGVSIADEEALMRRHWQCNEESSIRKRGIKDNEVSMMNKGCWGGSIDDDEGLMRSHWWKEGIDNVIRGHQYGGCINDEEVSRTMRYQWYERGWWGGIDEESALTMQWGVINKEDISMIKRYQGQWGINNETRLTRRKHWWIWGIDEAALMRRRHWQCN